MTYEDEPYGPYCECGGEGCFPTELPKAAWEVAGLVDDGRVAIAAHHDPPTGCVVIEVRGAWSIAAAP